VSVYCNAGFYIQRGVGGTKSRLDCVRDDELLVICNRFCRFSSRTLLKTEFSNAIPAWNWKTLSRKLVSFFSSLLAIELSPIGLQS
jgi:hypothetical protein